MKSCSVLPFLPEMFRSKDDVIRMNSPIIANKIALFIGFYYHDSIIMFNYSLLCFSIITVIDDTVFNLIIKPLPLISHCLFSVFCFHGASDMIVFYFPQAARIERMERYWKKEALPVPGASCLTEFPSKALCL